MDCSGETVPVVRHRLLKSDKLTLKTDFDAVKEQGRSAAGVPVRRLSALWVALGVSWAARMVLPMLMLPSERGISLTKCP